MTWLSSNHLILRGVGRLFTASQLYSVSYDIWFKQNTSIRESQQKPTTEIHNGYACVTKMFNGLPDLCTISGVI